MMKKPVLAVALLAAIPMGAASAADIDLVEQARDGGVALLAILACRS
jgi:opacity protein-like surface antigen